MKGRVIRYFKTFSEQQRQDYEKPVRVGFSSIDYIDCERHGYRNKVKEYLDEIRPYLKDIISN